ncbi:MAG: OmpA family protein, partial [Ignavibacteriaceae bacterium]
EMKLQITMLSVFIILSVSANSFAQFDLGEKIKKKVERKIEHETDKAIDKGIDETTDAVKNSGKAEDKEKESAGNNKEIENSRNESDESNSSGINETKKELKLWSKYDFVPGDKVIFEDNLSGEESGEFPSRWDLTSGSAENASLGNDNVIHLVHNNTIIFPLMEKEDFLPDVFTIEFDVYFERLADRRSDIYKIRFFKGTNNVIKLKGGKKQYSIDISWNQVKMGNLGGKTASFREEKKNWVPKWKHIAISFNKRSIKLYMNEERLLNIPNLGYKPEMFSIGANFDDRFIKMSLIKNIRVNEGGKNLYDRIMADGKFVTHGILFEINKAEINAKSMGTINEIIKLMKKYPDLKFSIEGHTDSDGEESFNQELSEERAGSVKNLLVELGIDASRLKTKGWGESKSLNNNSTPEEKANNRRVEFIRI